MSHQHQSVKHINGTNELNMNKYHVFTLLEGLFVPQ